MKKVLITGGCGFIGSNLVRYLIENHPDYQFINLDALTYAGRRENLSGLERLPNYRFVHGRIEDTKVVEPIMREGIDTVLHLAAESHVDRSIDDGGAFIRTNVEGSYVLLDLARRNDVKTFVQISTDEVYGSLGAEGRFTENSPIDPSSPYSASKASADLIALAFNHTWGMNVMITRCSNNYGPYQFPEKMIPLFITNAFEDQQVPVYGDGMNIRDWIHVIDHCRAIEMVWKNGKAGEVYNVGADNERTNIELTRMILKDCGKDESLMRYVKDRPGHDRRYAIDSAKIRSQIGWLPSFDFEQGLKDTISWYKANTDWWRKIKLNDPNYRAFCERLYGAAPKLGKSAIAEK
ncbi:MAG: dTDP-glucose 4,6-dehydratase [Candidatus Riflebacteria bacterium]|nr:dTDP-glucose 4,6-dehydratase [Candidatus Riflebacteria bacterium]